MPLLSIFIDNHPLISFSYTSHTLLDYLDNMLFHSYYHNIELTDLMATVYLLPKTFSIHGFSVDDSIREELVNNINIPLKKCIHDFHEKRLLTLAMGYANKHSIFTTLPKELVIEIGQAMNSIHAQNRK